MNIFDAIVNRKTVIKFKKDPVDDKLIGVMLYMATHAHSAGENQEWNFIVVRDEDRKGKLYKAALEHPLLKEAPVCIVVCADLEKASLRFQKRGEVFYSVQDTAAATMLMLVTANALGLGAAWIGSFDEEMVKDALYLPDKLRPVAIVAVGYPEKAEERKERIPFDNLTWYNIYGKKYEFSYLFQPGARKEVEIKPVGNLIEDALKKLKEDFLKKMKKE
ncbi:MAG: nitroreductase family protein [Candidatus Aenigmatarchaeota archaeon]